MPEGKISQNSDSSQDIIGFQNKPSTPKIKKTATTRVKNRNSAIPKNIANRMSRRVAFTTGIPTLSGMGVFVGSYFLISKGIAEIAPTVTLVSSAMCFFVGLLGLSYGILSASWDLNPGSFLGFENIKPNINRIKDAFKNNKKDVID